jgi:predicted phosphodiesterase
MRVAVIADIHGNLEALNAVLADIERRRVDLIVNLGDIVSGPLKPSETIDRLLPLGLPSIRGNHERQLLTFDVENMGESDRFAAARIEPAQRAWLAALPETLLLGDGIFLCHGTPANDLDYLLESVDHTGCCAAQVHEIKERLAGCEAALIVCAHSHKPRVVHLGDRCLVLNPGSVGLQAYEASKPHPHVMQTGSPHARYAIASKEGDQWSAELVQVEYDWEAAAQLAQANNRPDWARALRSGRV